MQKVYGINGEDEYLYISFNLKFLVCVKLFKQDRLNADVFEERLYIAAVHFNELSYVLCNAYCR